MADSDEEYDKRRARDKFRRERSDYQPGEREREVSHGAPRQDWQNSHRENWNRQRTIVREYEIRPQRAREVQRGYSPQPPPFKRPRRDWDAYSYEVPAQYGSNYPSSNWTPTHDATSSGYSSSYYGGDRSASSGGVTTHTGLSSSKAEADRGDAGPTEPAMMTFKQFLATADDGIGDDEAVKKYNDYKMEFKKLQLNEFFLSHKDEEWMKSKYHPEEFEKRRAEQLAVINKRLEIFLEFLDQGKIDQIHLDADGHDDVIKLMDSTVIKLEGGTDEDLKILDDSELLLQCQNTPVTEPVATPPQKIEDKPVEGETQVKTEKVVEEDKTGPEAEWESNSQEGNETEIAPQKLENGGREENNAEALPPQEPTPMDITENAIKPEANEINDEKISSSVEDAPTEVKREDPLPVEAPANKGPKALHLTSSIFLRNLAPSITKAEVEALCKRYGGFMRVSLADPAIERRFFRRGWVTFERNVNVKEICWNLNNIRLRDCELGAIVNRDLTRRVRTVSGMTAHKQVVRSDIKLAAKIIQNLDQKQGLWTTKPTDGHDKQPTFGLISHNPLLKNITDYLIEEASAEEEELLGVGNNGQEPAVGTTTDDVGDKKEAAESSPTIDRDEALCKVLDRLLLYLRIVHSVDYYNHIDYPNEDEMPNRCGIMHGRGPAPSSSVTQQDLGDYTKLFESKIQPFLEATKDLSEDEIAKLGKKDIESEVEKFLTTNTVELGKDKWLCPLSGKKFKAPDFVRKHIQNKHGEKIEEVKKDTVFFNNYIADPKRPQLPPHPGSTKGPAPAPSPQGGAGGGYYNKGGGDSYGGFNQQYQGYGREYGMEYKRRGYGHPGGGGYGRGGGYSEAYHRGGGGGYYQKGLVSGSARAAAAAAAQVAVPRTNPHSSREIISYRDLDAPPDPELL